MGFVLLPYFRLLVFLFHGLATGRFSLFRREGQCKGNRRFGAMDEEQVTQVNMKNHEEHNSLNLRVRNYERNDDKYLFGTQEVLHGRGYGFGTNGFISLVRLIPFN